MFSNRTKKRMYYPRLSEIRIERQKKQSEIADFLYISQQQYSLYEIGKREIPSSHICKLAGFYGVTTDYLMGLTDEKT